MLNNNNNNSSVIWFGEEASGFPRWNTYGMHLWLCIMPYKMIGLRWETFVSDVPITGCGGVWFGLLLWGGAALEEEMLLLAVVVGKALRGILISRNTLSLRFLKGWSCQSAVQKVEPTGNEKHPGGALLKSYITRISYFRFTLPRKRGTVLSCQEWAMKFTKVAAGLGSPGDTYSGFHTLVVGCGELLLLGAVYVAMEPWPGTFWWLKKNWHAACDSIDFALERREWKTSPEAAVPWSFQLHCGLASPLGWPWWAAVLIPFPCFYFHHHCHRSLLDVLVEILQIFKKRNWVRGLWNREVCTFKGFQHTQMVYRGQGLSAFLFCDIDFFLSFVW